jgi:hypothetical protein
MTFFKWEGKPKKRVWFETVGNRRILHVDASEAMRIMEAKIAKMTPEEIARNEAEADRLEAELNAEQDDEQGDPGEAVREPEQPSPGAAGRLNIYLLEADSEFDNYQGDHVVKEGFRPFYDAAFARPVKFDNEAPTADRVFYCQMMGGKYHQADLQHPRFDLGSLVLIHSEPDNPADPHALAVCVLEGKRILKAGYLPRELAAALAPLIASGEGGGGMGVVIQTVVSGGVRTGLRIVGSVGREMLVETVEKSGAT